MFYPLRRMLQNHSCCSLWRYHDVLTRFSMTFRVIDLFSGCGGLSCGFNQEGFEIIAAVEINSIALKTYANNFPNTLVINQDITKIDPGDLRRKLRLQRGELDCLIGREVPPLLWSSERLGYTIPEGEHRSWQKCTGPTPRSLSEKRCGSLRPVASRLLTSPVS
jgi:hypothetical protein